MFTGSVDRLWRFHPTLICSSGVAFSGGAGACGLPPLPALSPDSSGAQSDLHADSGVPTQPDTSLFSMNLPGASAPGPFFTPAGLHASRKPSPSGSSTSRVKRSEEHTSELQSLMRNSYAV